MRTPSEQNGLVAVLDALGASSYSSQEIQRFSDSRDIVLGLLDKKAEDLQLDPQAVTTFTFNDTVVVVLKTGSQAETEENITPFFMLLRKFMVDSLKNGIMFRGAVAEGTFYAKDDANIVMGQATTDAATWYDKADWIGIHATPRTSLVISKCLEAAAATKSHVMIDYNVPLSAGGVVQAKVVNWARAFFLPRISPCEEGENPRAKLLELLTIHQMPKGTEGKYINTLAFFDYAERDHMAEKARKTRK